VVDFLQVVVDAASLGSLYALLALAIGLLFGIMRLVNFAQGDYITLGAYALILPTGELSARASRISPRPVSLWFLKVAVSSEH
jgi:branched-chain amino acid transport system permease protein